MKFSIFLLMFSTSLRADIHTDLQGLLSEGGALESALSGFTFNQQGSCTALGSLNRSLEDYTASIKSTAETMPAFSVTAADLEAIDGLSYLVRNMGVESLRLTAELSSITDTAQLFEYRAGLSAMLQLSSDIGAMADRILEMSDRILVMSDNIGLMAERILITQTIQNGNIALTQASILTTQQNMVLLSNSLSTIVYNLTLGQIINDADALSFTMGGVTLSNTNMAEELAALQTQTTALLNMTTNMLQAVVENSANASHYINADTLTMAGDLSVIHKALALSLESYANTINQIAPLTQTAVLSDAAVSMLQLLKDIGVMSDRIMEMTDNIYVMADNIGLMSDNIVATQNLQMGNVALTESSLLTSQSIMINLIKNFGL
jgi:tRNA pseudouridine-54 N-methylase